MSPFERSDPEGRAGAVDQAVRVLSEADPGACRRAAPALDVLLGGVRGSAWPEVAWSFSRLTGDGFPLEFTFLPVDRSIRYAVEVAGPEIEEAERLAHAEQLLALLGAPPLSDDVRRCFERVQSGGHLRFGVWAGGRHTAESDRYKLYVEVPRAGSGEAAGMVRTLLGDVPPIPGRATPLRMIGYEPETGRTEFYFRTEGLDPWEVSALLRRAGLEPLEGQMLGLLEAAYGQPIQDGLPGSNIGFSFATDERGSPAVLSIFAFAHSVCGADRSIRSRLFELAESRGWDWHAYGAISLPTATRRVRPTYHTMLSFVAAPGAPVFLAIGLRPPGLEAT